MRRLIKYSESGEGFRPPADHAVFALQTRLANETEDKRPRWMLPFALCFALGVWLAVLFMAVAPGPAVQFVRWSEATIAHWSAQAETVVRQQPSAKASALVAPCDKARRGRAPRLNACERLPLRSSLR